MVKIAYILLCHRDPAGVIQQIQRLVAGGDFVAIHFDGRASDSEYQEIQALFADNELVTFAQRVKCGWGEWSLVQATLNTLMAAEESFPRATHFYMVSGDCMPIKSAEYAHEFLANSNFDHIESFDYFNTDWIKTGMREERLVYRHYFNERKSKPLFYAALELQRKLKLKRAVPKDLDMMIGSQWWCLRRKTVEAIFAFLSKRRDVVRFFKTTWIPDETFFQTLVRHLVPHAQIDPRTLTFLMFSDYGMPVQFYNDQYDMLTSQDFLFARKISPDALELKKRLGALYISGKSDFVLSNEGAKLHRYLSQQGRYGRRFAPRFWETESTIGRERELLIVVCKKWHIAKRLLRSIQRATNLHGVEFLFDEKNANLPHLGGIENSMEKRTRHRRAMMRMLFDYYETNRMLICLDPNNLELLHDFYTDRCTTKILEIQCGYDDEYLIGHAIRSGLAGENSDDDALQQLLPTIRQEFSLESDVIKDAEFPNYYQINEHGNDIENASSIGAFLGIQEAAAGEIARTEQLFAE